MFLAIAGALALMAFAPAASASSATGAQLTSVFERSDVVYCDTGCSSLSRMAEAGRSFATGRRGPRQTNPCFTATRNYDARESAIRYATGSRRRL
jgi:hypothetical protein